MIYADKHSAFFAKTGFASFENSRFLTFLQKKNHFFMKNLMFLYKKIKTQQSD
jgi:hypothetical protein